MTRGALPPGVNMGFRFEDGFEDGFEDNSLFVISIIGIAEIAALLLVIETPYGSSAD